MVILTKTTLVCHRSIYLGDASGVHFTCERISAVQIRTNMYDVIPEIAEQTANSDDATCYQTDTIIPSHALTGATQIRTLPSDTGLPAASSWVG